jgi:hypothetical protein
MKDKWYMIGWFILIMGILTIVYLPSLAPLFIGITMAMVAIVGYFIDDQSSEKHLRKQRVDISPQWVRIIGTVVQLMISTAISLTVVDIRLAADVFAGAMVTVALADVVVMWRHLKSLDRFSRKPLPAYFIGFSSPYRMAAACPRLCYLTTSLIYSAFLIGIAYGISRIEHRGNILSLILQILVVIILLILAFYYLISAFSKRAWRRLRRQSLATARYLERAPRLRVALDLFLAFLSLLIPVYDLYQRFLLW